VILSNAMLIGVARRIHAMGIPVICTLQGEDGFLDSLPEPYRAQAWRTLRERAADVDGFIPVSQFHGTHMKDRLGLREDRLHVVHNGLDLSPFNGTTNAVPPAEPTIGYFARLCKDKGLGCLVDAYLILRRESPEPVQLLIGGAMTKTDEPFVDRMQARLREAGVEGEVTWRPNTDLAGKVRLLQSCSVFSVPATYGESFGLYVIEALACGVPVVQPNHAAFPELLAVTGGGVLVPPDDPAALARAWRNLIADPARARELGYAGRTKVLSHFTAARMATDVLAVCRKVTSRGPQPT